MAALPPVVGALVARPLWRRGEFIFGNIAGGAVIFGSALGMIFRESVDLDLATRRCFEDGYLLCWPSPGPFTRYAIYACLAGLEVIGLFTASLRVERRLRDRHHAPEWRSP